MQDYQYPLDIEWTTDEMIRVVNLWQALEDSYEKGLAAKDFLFAYQEFKSVVKSIGEERQLGREFEKLSGYSLYKTVQQAKKYPDKKLKMGG
ncbi:UPF0223 family protein [Tetragenococcus koreensis]|uniref:Uncharacterized protein n=1 Tax=Tetragenococcus koreensis TaxID=290335 RepID=A0AAN4RKV4_9ENTE|nr:UPF0223 family protein [Tetragenococcus koreensis]AYW45150.1 hypothetical protein C7K43_03900 [Tetragenococcus koreensis]MCF1584487.1 UPF0223 family protein [Tetragenococcus koreensis]MCF1614036.1 UPF0223 family protein [Tetragenococcus koreensis]MCF1616546.1 UPF0223 family protein [Tetragenococcus koreensis]MCF1618632.1 UPF0223 family protein [Tetragenococcus koreensis]